MLLVQKQGIVGLNVAGNSNSPTSSQHVRTLLLYHLIGVFFEVPEGFFSLSLHSLVLLLLLLPHVLPTQHRIRWLSRRVCRIQLVN